MKKPLGRRNGAENMRKVTVAAIQMKCNGTREENIRRTVGFVEEAAKNGANIILPSELFETNYFCQEKQYEHYKLALPVEENEAVKELQKVAAAYQVVIPVSVYEREGNSFYNTVVMLDADGSIMGTYRKTHIPDDHFYQEKFYFTPGDTGFKVWDTRYGKIGVGICWDQWFPEAARCMALMGAEILCYPTAIGSEPILECDSMPHWRRCMQGHSAANLMPVIAANRIGYEKISPCEENNHQESALEFYGSSFITDETGEIVADGSRDKEEILYAEIDLDAAEDMRLSWGVFRDRRPEMYRILTK